MANRSSLELLRENRIATDYLTTLDKLYGYSVTSSIKRKYDIICGDSTIPERTLGGTTREDLRSIGEVVCWDIDQNQDFPNVAVDSVTSRPS